MTPTLSRESARYCGGAISVGELRRLLLTIEWLFIAVAVVGSLSLALCSHKIANTWLHAEVLAPFEVQMSIIFMGVVIALRWVGGVFRGAIAGFEKMAWLGCFNSGIATFRFVVVLFVLHSLGARPTVFFGYQAIMAILELALLRWKLYRLIPPTTVKMNTKWTWASVKPVIVFSASIAFTSSIWVMVTQLDKLVLSKILTLTNYGYFSLAVVVANGVSLLTGPISAALMPRLARLVAAADDAGVILLYREGTQMVAILVMPAAMMLCYFAPEVLFAWTGNWTIASKAGPVLRLYALGNCFLALLGFQYYLQYAKGNLKLHVLGNVILVVALIPTVIWATLRFGSIGAGATWVGVNALFLIFWSPLVHHRFLPGIHAVWLRVDIGYIAIPVVVVGGLINWALVRSGSRIVLGVELIAVGSVLGLVGLIGSSWGRARMGRVFSMALK